MTQTTGYSLISADSHVLEPTDLFAKRVPGRVRDRVPKVASMNGGSAWLVDGADPVELPASAATGSGYRQLKGKKPGAGIRFDEVLPGLFDPGERLKLQIVDSVDAEVLYPYPALWEAVRHLDDEIQLSCIRAYNDWIAEFTAHSPDRLIGLGKIPSRSGDAAHTELERCIGELKLRGVVLDEWPGDGDVGPGDPSAEAFWQTVSDADIPVSIHYGIGRTAPTKPPSGIFPGMTPPLAESTGMSLLRTGIFNRCPNLRFVLAHADAGWAYYWLEVMDATYLRRRHLKDWQLPFDDPEALPSQFIRRHYWFTFHHDRSAVKNRHLLGPAHLLWSSNMPLDDANWPDSREQAARVIDGVAVEEGRALLAENTARLYRLPGYEDGFTTSAIESFDDLVHVV
jgi:predicted TIM-barrel fold metal-dependent hydrolase